jgi:hypothetical protein
MILAVLPPRVARILLLLLGSPSILLGAGELDETHRVLVDGSRDVLVDRAFVPSERSVHGEVRGIRRDGGVCVQTILYSRILRRGLAGIERKEREAWPPDRDGFEDSSLYLSSLEDASRQMLSRSDNSRNPEDPKQKMAIEFVLSDTRAFHAIYDVDLSESETGVVIEAKEIVALRDASPSYVSRAMRLMVASAFHVDDATAETILATPDDTKVVR